MIIISNPRPVETNIVLSQPRQDNDTPPPNGCPSFIHCNSLVVVVGGLQSLHSASPPQTNLGIRAGETADTLPLLSRLPYLLSCLSPFRLRSPRSFPLSPTTLLVRVCGLFVSQACTSQGVRVALRYLERCPPWARSILRSIRGTRPPITNLRV